VLSTDSAAGLPAGFVPARRERMPWASGIRADGDSEPVAHPRRSGADDREFRYHGRAGLRARETLRRFYPAREFEPVWIDENGLLPHAQAFLDWLETGPARQGLRSGDYHLDAMESLELDRVGALVDMELALSDALLIVGSHFLAGRLNPETLDSERVANRKHRDLAPLLEQVGSGAGALLETLLPTAAG
jgi:hypothetical protein